MQCILSAELTKNALLQTIGRIPGYQQTWKTNLSLLGVVQANQISLYPLASRNH